MSQQEAEARDHLLGVTLALHQAMAADAPTLCWSPYSVLTALGLVAAGSAGTTREELAELLGGSTDADLTQLRESLGQAATLAERSADAVLAVASTLWVDGQLRLRPDYERRLTGWPAAALRTTGLRADPAGARALINSAIAHTTNGLIPELLGTTAITPDTLAVLVNALYLKLAWAQAFERDDTLEQAFHGVRHDATVPMMHATRRMRYAAAGGLGAVTLPAKAGVEVSVVLPDAAEPSAALRALRDLRPGPLGELLDAARARQVALALPRFTVRTQTELTTVLRGLGVHAMFGRQADFSPLAEQQLYVDAVLHEAVLRVDEQGIEGAAATAAVFRTMAMAVGEVEPVPFVADRPFLMLVRHAASGSVYFSALVGQLPTAPAGNPAAPA
ncbi:MAG: serpin family protein [Sciscionella sp.]